MTDPERLKYFAAKSAWHRRDQRTPSGRCTWAQWWENRYGERLAGYVERLRGSVPP